jgi:8-oxo-dGTP diphosphatase
MSDVVLQVAMKAVIVKDGKVLILREAATYGEGTQRGRYHMPGGRINPGEPFEDALRREIREETGLEVDIQYPIYAGEWRPVIRDVPHQIVATFFVCRPKTDKVVLSTEHDDYQWVRPADRAQYDIMTPEDKVIDRYAAWATKLGEL